MAGVITMVVIGGVRRLGKVAERIIPVMTIMYFIGGLVIIISNFNHISYAIISIITSAFNTQAVGGGVLGYTIKEAMRFGVARGLILMKLEKEVHQYSTQLQLQIIQQGRDFME